MEEKNYKKKVVLTSAQFQSRLSAGTLEEGVDYEISDAPYGVTINGTDATVSNGKWNIPVASSSALGVVKEGNGLIVDASGVIRINKASDAVIAAKVNNYNPIVPANLDVALKASLGNYNGTAFTDAEKETAIHTIGLFTEDTTDNWSTYSGNADCVNVVEA